MQKAISFDLKSESSDAIAPLAFGHDAPMGVVVRGRAAYGEGNETVVTQNLPGSSIESGSIDWAGVGPLGASAKGRVNLRIRPNIIRITA